MAREKTRFKLTGKNPTTHLRLWLNICFAVSVFIFTITAGPYRSGPASSAIGANEIVDLALILAVDCSYSVDNTEFRLQMDGLALAFRKREVVEAITNGPSGKIAVSVVQWSDSKNQIIAIPWTIISGKKSAAQLSLRLAQASRMTASGGTSITTMIKKGAVMLSRLPFFAERKVIDISADGRNNNGGDPRLIRSIVTANGITINGLAIINEVATLDKYFESHITGGPGSFVIVANDYNAYAAAIERKLILEILGPNLV